MDGKDETEAFASQGLFEDLQPSERQEFLTSFRNLANRWEGCVRADVTELIRLVGSGKSPFSKEAEAVIDTMRRHLYNYQYHHRRAVDWDRMLNFPTGVLASRFGKSVEDMVEGLTAEQVRELALKYVKGE